MCIPLGAIIPMLLVFGWQPTPDHVWELMRPNFMGEPVAVRRVLIEVDGHGCPLFRELLLEKAVPA